MSSGGLKAEIDELLEEARALVMYVARRGDEVGVDAGQREFEDLVDAVAEVDVEDPSARAVGNLHVAYGKLTALTYKARQVNGRTLLDTKGGKRFTFWARVRRFRPLWLGFLLFCGALWLTAGKTAEPFASLRPLLLPAVWGALGACVFLGKRISDRLAEMAYEDARMRGDGIRVFLGAMLGVVAVGLFFPELDGSEVALTEKLATLAEQLQLVREDVAPPGEEIPPLDVPANGDAGVVFGVAPATLAFLAGLGVKPVYAAFESLSEALASRLKASAKQRPE